MARDDTAALARVAATGVAVADPFPPGPRGVIAVLRALRRFKADPLGLLDALRAEHGGIAGLRVARQRFVIVGDPVHARHTLADHAHNYVKGWTYDPLREVLGNGLLTSDGRHWRKTRRMIQPAFHRTSLARLVPAMSECADHTVARWDELAGTGEAIDVAEHMTDLALDVSTRTLLATGFTEAERRQLKDAVHVAALEAQRRLRQPVRYSLPFPTFARRRMRRAIARLDDAIYGVIDRRLGDPAEHTDLLALIMGARDADTGRPLDRRELRDELITLFVAGYESTSVALSWLWHHLDQNHAARARLERELDAREGAELSFESVFALRYAHAVVKESLRVMPPAWLFGQHAIDDDEIGGYRIPKGTVVMVSPYLLHRDAAYWPDPLAFDPDRWLTENRDPDRHKYAWLPFSGGARNCIGSHFAVMEMIVALVKLAARFHVNTVPGHPVVPDCLSTVGFKHGLRATISRR